MAPCVIPTLQVRAIAMFIYLPVTDVFNEAFSSEGDIPRMIGWFMNNELERM
jgi:hypothetical protein